MNRQIKTPSFARILEVYERNGISEGTFQKLIDWLTRPPSSEEWTDTLRHWLLILGSLLCVSGVIYFGAYNWSALHRFQKFGIVELLFAAFAVGVVSRGLDSKEGPILVVGASIMVGALLALLGQTYQTGADSFLLFLAWSVLITPWCLVARSNALWVLQLGLFNLTFCLHWGQRLKALEADHFILSYFALNLVLAIAWLVLSLKVRWMNSAIAEVLLFVSLVPLTFRSCFAIFDIFDAGHVCFSVLLLTLGALVASRRERLATMVTVASSLLCLGTALSIRIFLELEIVGILFIGLSILAQVGLIVRLLNPLYAARKQMVSHVDEPEPEQVKSPESLLADRLGIELSEAREVYQQSDELPWFAQALIGGGAWLASLFVLAFFLVWIANSEGLLLMAGLGLYGASLYFRNQWQDGHFARHALLSTHLSAIMVTVAALAGLGSYNDGLVPAVAALALLSFSVWKYKDTLGQVFFGAGVVSSGLWAWIVLLEEYGLLIGLFLSACGMAYLAAKQRLLFEGQWASSWQPAFRGATAAFLMAASYPLMESLQPALNTTLTVLLGLLTVWFSRYLKHPVLVQAGLGLLALISYNVPTLIASILVFLLGFFTRQELVKAMALAALVASGSFFYYSLSLSLMVKAITLLSSGGFLLALRVMLRPRRSE